MKKQQNKIRKAFDKLKKEKIEIKIIDGGFKEAFTGLALSSLISYGPEIVQGLKKK